MSEQKNTKEIVASLRNDYAPDFHVLDDMNLGANLIEQQQTCIAGLEQQLAASQRETQAAEKCIEDIEKYNLESLNARHGSIAYIIDEWRSSHEAKEKSK